MMASELVEVFSYDSYSRTHQRRDSMNAQTLTRYDWSILRHNYYINIHNYHIYYNNNIIK